MLINKKYKLILLNNKTHAHYSISINWIIGYCFMIMTSLIIAFCVFGLYRFIKPHAVQKELLEIYAKNANIEDMLTILQENQIIDSAIINKYDFHLIPDTPPVYGIVTKGIITNGFSPHNGVDIATKSNAKVKATQKGMVVFSDILNDYGNTIIISHPNNYYSIYSHLNKSLLKEREYVKKNQLIGYVGQTGNSNAPHLHFEIWKNHHIIDPRNLIKEYKIKDVSIE